MWVAVVVAVVQIVAMAGVQVRYASPSRGLGSIFVQFFFSKCLNLINVSKPDIRLATACEMRMFGIHLLRMWRSKI